MIQEFVEQSEQNLFNMLRANWFAIANFVSFWPNRPEGGFGAKFAQQIDLLSLPDNKICSANWFAQQIRPRTGNEQILFNMLSKWAYWTKFVQFVQYATKWANCTNAFVAYAKQNEQIEQNLFNMLSKFQDQDKANCTNCTICSICPICYSKLNKSICYSKCSKCICSICLANEQIEQSEQSLFNML